MLITDFLSAGAVFEGLVHRHKARQQSDERSNSLILTMS